MKRRNWLDGLYEHSPWIAQAALAHRPFRSLAHLKHVMAGVVAEAGHEAQVALVRAHPELAGKAMVSKTLTAESTHEQGKAGLADCTPAEFAKIQQLNADYNAKFGFPFVLAVRGPRGAGLSRREIIDAFERRLDNPPDFELAECLRNIHRIVELRLNDKFGYEPALGNWVWDRLESLAGYSDPGYREQGQLTVTYLTDAHRQAAAQIGQDMRDCGFDEVAIDAVGNVVGIYFASAQMPSPGQGRDGVGSGHITPNGAVRSRRLLTGSHYDTVRNGGKYDGRLGIYTPMACVRALAGRGERLPFDLEVVAFSEEEGQRYKATFLGSGALIGSFDAALAGPEGRRRRHLARGHEARRACRRRWRPSPRCAAIRPTTWASSRSTSSRARCSTKATCRWASSPRSTAACATSARPSAWPATPAPRR